MTNEFLLNCLKKMYPDARCELDFTSDFSLLCAILLSAQTTDKQVNKITPSLFAKYPDAICMKNASLTDLEEIIRPLGLAKSKSKYLLNLATSLVEKFDGKVPTSVSDLETLPGVGHKTACVFMAEFYGEPHVAVDTHVRRVSNRLGLVKTDDVLKIEKELEKRFDKKDYISLHLGLLFLGRYRCKSKAPNCMDCLLKNECEEYKNANKDE